MNKSRLAPRPYDRLLHKALEYLTDAAEVSRNGDTKLRLKKMDEATTLMQSYDILYGHVV